MCYTAYNYSVETFYVAGHLDALSSTGFFEGWAYDTEFPTRPLHVAILGADGQPSAQGLAHRYRDDLARAQCGIGWCAFRLRAQASPSRPRNGPLFLIEQSSGQLIHQTLRIDYLEASADEAEASDDFTNIDPFVLGDVEQLSQCEFVLEDFIQAEGIETFIRTAYIYVLGRLVDEAGQIDYGRKIRQGAITPYAMLLALSQSEEFRSRPRRLAAPYSSGFPFVGA